MERAISGSREQFHGNAVPAREREKRNVMIATAQGNVESAEVLDTIHIATNVRGLGILQKGVSGVEATACAQIAVAKDIAVIAMGKGNARYAMVIV